MINKIVLIVWAVWNFTIVVVHGQEALNENEHKHLIRKINEIRHNAKPYASNSEDLKWDESIAQGTVQRIKKCSLQYDHNILYGQTIYGEKDEQSVMNTAFLDDALKYWGNHETPTIRYDEKIRGSLIGIGKYFHYSQLVWAKSKKIGCAHHVCNGKRLLICDFDESGNINGKEWYITCNKYHEFDRATGKCYPLEDSGDSDDGLSKFEICGIVFACVAVLVLLFIGIFVLRNKTKQRDTSFQTPQNRKIVCDIDTTKEGRIEMNTPNTPIAHL